jgi:hypothetical protein
MRRWLGVALHPQRPLWLPFRSNAKLGLDARRHGVMMPTCPMMPASPKSCSPPSWSPLPY